MQRYQHHYTSGDLCDSPSGMDLHVLKPCSGLMLRFPPSVGYPNIGIDHLWWSHHQGLGCFSFSGVFTLEPATL